LGQNRWKGKETFFGQNSGIMMTEIDRDNDDGN
jgi:hypothetical protein